MLWINEGCGIALGGYIYYPPTPAIGRCTCEDLANKPSMSPVKLTRIAINQTALNILYRRRGGRADTL